MIRKLFLFIAVVSFITLINGIFPTAVVHAYVNVDGYFKSDGTYVSPYVRSNPNALRYDNYSYDGGDLFNSSYYPSSRSYSSDWYSPSYLTDPDYYYGQSLYNNYSFDYDYSPSSYDYGYYSSYDYDYYDDPWDWDY